VKKLFALLVVFSLAAIGCEEKKSTPGKPVDTSKSAPKPDPTTPKPDPTTPKPDPTTKKEESTAKKDESTKKKEGGPDLGKPKEGGK